MKKSPLVPVLLVVVALAIVIPLVAVAAVRALPGRYAYYLPEPLQRLREKPHPETLPTSVLSATLFVPSPRPPTPSPAAPPTETPTPPPTSLPTETPAPSATPSPTLPPRVVLTGIRHEHQGWNNCGPTTLAMALSYWGRDETQYDLVPLLKPDPEDKHVDAVDMEAYARDVGLGIIVRVNGSVDRLKELLRAGFPVIVASWHVRDASDQLGHYRLIAGYDDATSEFILQDSLDGPDLPIGYQALDELWRVYNRKYVLVYPPEKSDALAGVLAGDLDDAGMYERAVEQAHFEAANPPGTCVAYAKCGDWVAFSWFNAGTSLTSLGRHAEAAAAYDQARQLGLPYRILWYQFGPYESYQAVGRYDDVIALADATLATARNLEESYYWRGMARLAQGDTRDARADFGAALRYHEGWPPAMAALAEMDSSQ